MTRHFRLRPLTPVHIGSKERLAPEDYVLESSYLVRLNVPMILAALSSDQRHEFERDLDAGRLRAAQSRLGDFWRALPPSSRPGFERFRTRVGDSAREELRQLVARPERSGEVAALPRNPYTGDVVIPGSAIKGAIRTALVSQRVNGPARAAFEERRRNERPDRLALALEEAAFDYRRAATESDPLRLLKVADASWPASAVRVDRAMLHKLGRGGDDGMQIHLERLECRADGVPPPDCVVAISLKEPATLSAPERQLFRVLFDWDALWSACSTFFRGRMQAEGDHFDEVARHAGAWWPSQKELGGLLLRVGHYCHFDSLSVDGFREGWNARRREPIHEIGATRTLCEIAPGTRVPFGWVLLEPV